MDTIGTIRGYLDFYLRQKRGEALNGQQGRRAIVRDVIARCAVLQIVETGTYRGATTEWLTQFGLPVHTVEINWRFWTFSRLRLRNNPLVYQAYGDSVVFLRDFADRPQNRIATLFYLDAHWREHLPLAEELKIIQSQYSSAVVVIDDFSVPDDPGYGFDDYGPGRRLTADYIADVLAGGFAAYSPRISSSEETGGRRGSVVLCTADMAAKLDTVPTLRPLVTPAS